MSRSLCFGVLALAAAACGNKDPIAQPDGADAQPEVTIEMTPIGPSVEDTEAYRAALLGQPEVLAVVGDHRVRLLHFELLPEVLPGTDQFMPTESFDAVLVDYDTNTNYEVQGRIGDDTPLTVAVTHRQPAPSLEEFEEAVEIALEEDPALAAAHASGEVRFFSAMPPLIDSDDGDRIISLGIRDVDSLDDTEIAGANISDRIIVHYEDRAPPTAKAIGFVCNPPPSAGGSGVGRGTAGWAQMRMMQGGQEIWSMFVRRPSASGGIDGSGVELFNVAYKGRRILDRAHVPILNVLYENNACGPYRDWQWQENPFQIGPVIANVGPDIVVTQWAKTIRELRDDTGNFTGVAAFWDPARDEAVLISELAAGWYRYPTEWRFGLDGTIRPLFGFDAVENGCTCRRHTHHAYWRMDFNIANSGNTVAEYDGGVWSDITEEFEQVRDDANGRHWKVSNPNTGHEVILEPSGPEDGPERYGIADMWVVADDPGEIDDANAPPPQIPTQARIPAFVNGESTENTDVVVWWGGHFIHDDADPATNQTHTVKWRITPNW